MFQLSLELEVKEIDEIKMIAINVYKIFFVESTLLVHV